MFPKPIIDIVKIEKKTKAGNVREVFSEHTVFSVSLTEYG